METLFGSPSLHKKQAGLWLMLRFQWVQCALPHRTVQSLRAYSADRFPLGFHFQTRSFGCVIDIKNDYFWMRRGESISADRILPSRAGVKRRKWSEAARDTASVMQLVCLSVCLSVSRCRCICACLRLCANSCVGRDGWDDTINTWHVADQWLADARSAGTRCSQNG